MSSKFKEMSFFTFKVIKCKLFFKTKRNLLLIQIISLFLSQINLIAPPRYVMTTTTLERTEGLSVLNQAMAVIKEKIEEKRGVFNIQMEVRNYTSPSFWHGDIANWRFKSAVNLVGFQSCI